MWSEPRPVGLTTLAALYLTLRRAHPGASGRAVIAYLLSDTDESFEQFIKRGGDQWKA